MSSDQIEVYAVFTRGLSDDTRQEALKDARKLQASNVHSYWDPGKLGTLYAKQFGWEGELAWDIYLFFQPGTLMSKDNFPPAPAVWFHQRSDVEAHKDKKATGRKMRARIEEIMKRYIKNKDSSG